MYDEILFYFPLFFFFLFLSLKFFLLALLLLSRLHTCLYGLCPFTVRLQFFCSCAKANLQRSLHATAALLSSGLISATFHFSVDPQPRSRKGQFTSHKATNPVKTRSEVIIRPLKKSWFDLYKSTQAYTPTIRSVFRLTIKGNSN